MTKKDRSNYLFSNKELAVLILPLIVEQLLAILVGIADTVMISSVGESAVSGVSLVDSIMVLLINLFAALATGGAVVAGQYLGQKDGENACIASEQLVWFIMIIAVAVMILMYLFQGIIFRGVFGSITEEVAHHSDIYYKIVTLSIPFIAVYNGGAAIFRAMGNSRISMLVSIIMNIINVVGNAVLVYGFHLGTAGVAIPTLVSRVVAAVLITALLCNQKLPLHIRKTLRYKFRRNMVSKILYIGIPNGMENSMFQLGKLIVLSLVSTFGTYAITANAVSNSIAAFHILPGQAAGLAVITVISRCVGAGDYEQVSYYTKKLHIFSYVFIILTVGSTFLIMPEIMKAYNLSELTARTTSRILYFHGTCAILIWPLSFTLPSVFRAAGDVKFAMTTSIVSMWVCRIVMSYVIGKYMGLGVFGIWVAMILDWCVRSICFVARYRSGRWKNKAVV